MLLAILGNIGYIYLMSDYAKQLAYFSVVLIELFFIASIGGLIYAATAVTGTSQIMEERKGALSLGALIVLLGFALFNCMLYCYHDQLMVAIAVIDATADFYR